MNLFRFSQGSYKLLDSCRTPGHFLPLVHKITFSLLLMGIITSCSQQTNIPEKQSSSGEIVKSVNNSSCPVMESRNWNAWIDRVGETEASLNVTGEVDLPTPGYKVEWQSGILDRRKPPAQRISISFVPPEGIVAQVITPTEVNFTMPSPILEYRSVTIYCGDKLLAEIPKVVAQETVILPIEVGTFTTDELFDAGGGGCGMTLWKSDIEATQNEFLFFHGIEDAKAFIIFDNKITNLSRTVTEGQDFYGQKTAQTFATDDKKITVDVEVNLGKKGKIESVSIPRTPIQ